MNKLNEMEIKVLLSLIKRANSQQLKGVAEIVTDKTNYEVLLNETQKLHKFKGV